MTRIASERDFMAFFGQTDRDLSSRLKEVNDIAVGWLARDFEREINVKIPFLADECSETLDDR